jgi:hypothetical protein
MLAPILHTAIIRYNLKAGLIFSALQAPILVITTTEMGIIGNPTYASVDGFILVMT